MRKAIVLLLAILMVFAMVACNEPEPEGKGDVLPVDKEKGQEKLLELGGEEPKAVTPSGFKITISTNFGNHLGDDSFEYSIGGKDGVYWIGMKGSYMFFRNHANKIYAYTVGDSSWSKYSADSLKDAIFSEPYDEILYCSYLDEIMSVLVDEGSDTNNGRDCRKYSVSYTDHDKKTYNLNIWVDKKYGFTVAIEVLEGGSDGLTYNVTDLKLSNLAAGEIPSGDMPSGYAAAHACDTYDD